MKSLLASCKELGSSWFIAAFISSLLTCIESELKLALMDKYLDKVALLDSAKLSFFGKHCSVIPFGRVVERVRRRLIYHFDKCFVYLGREEALSNQVMNSLMLEVPENLIE